MVVIIIGAVLVITKHWYFQTKEMLIEFKNHRIPVSIFLAVFLT
jgi:hypothetical protein